MTDAEKMREAAADICRRHGDVARHKLRTATVAHHADIWGAIVARCDMLHDAIRALPIPPVDASAPAADCQQAGLVTVGAPQITIRHGRNNDPYPEGWTLCVADNSVTYKLGGHYSVVEFDANTEEAHFSTNIDLGGLAFVFILEPDPLGGRRPKQYSTIEAAKAAAQADYEARILAALTPDPDRMLALTAAAAEAQAEARGMRKAADRAQEIANAAREVGLTLKMGSKAQIEIMERCWGAEDARMAITTLADATEAAAKGGV